MRRSLRLDLLIAAGLFVLPLAFFWQVTLGSRTLLPADNMYQYQPWAAYREQLGVPAVPHNSLLSDLVLENLPWKQFIRQSLAQGELPLWNPYIFAGVPFLAAGQHSAMYPFSIIYYVMPLEKAYGWFTVSQLWLAGMFMYLFMRGLGVRRLGSTLAAIAYQLSGFFIASVVFQMIIAAAAWLPFLLLMVEFTIRQRPAFGRSTVIPWVALGAIGLGLEILAGHVEFTYYALLIMGFWAACRLGYLLINPQPSLPAPLPQGEGGEIALTPSPSPGGEGRQMHGSEVPRPGGEGFRVRAKRLLKPAFALLALVILGLGVGAIQFIPMFELASYNFREGSASFEQVRSYAYPPRHALAFFVPNFYGSPAEHDYFDVFTGQQAAINWKRADGSAVTDTYWEVNKNYVEGACYVGLLTLALAVIALLNARFEKAPYARITTIGPYRGMFALLSVISVSFIFGTVAYAILYYGLPGINQLHSPFRWVFPLTLCLAGLAGFGAEALQRARGDLPHPLAPSPHAERGEQPSFTFRLARVIGWALIWIGGAIAAALILSRVFFAQLRGPIESLFHKLAGADMAFPNVEAFYSYEFRQILFLALFVIACGVVIRVSRCPIYLRAPRWIWPLPPAPLPPGEGSKGLRGVQDSIRQSTPTPNPSPIKREGLADQTSGVGSPSLLVGEGGGGRGEPSPDYLIYAQKFSIPIWEILALLVLALDLVVASAGFNPAADPAWLHFEPPAITWLKQHNPQEWRFASVVGPNTTKTMNANLGWLYGLQDVAGYDSMIPKQYAKLMKGIWEQGQLIFNRIAPIQEDDLYKPISGLLDGGTGGSPLDFLIIKYLITENEIYTEKHPSYNLAYQDKAVRIYENTGAGPRAYWFKDYTTEKHLAEIVDARFNQITINVTTPTPDSEQYRGLEYPDPIILILRDSYFPGWRAYIRPQGAPDDQEKELNIELREINFRAVRFGPGKWTIRFRYSPPSFQVGAFTTFIALVVLLFAVLIWLWRRFYTEDSSDTGNARRFAKNSIAPIVLNLFNRIIDFAFAAIMLRILGPANAGTYYYAVVIFGWFDTITNFGLNLLLTREVARDHTQAWRYLFNSSVLRLALAGIGVPLLIGFLAIQQAIDPVEPLAITAIAILYLGLIPGSLSYGLTALFYAFEKAEIPNAITTVSAILKATFGLAVLLAGWGVIGLAGASIVINVITLAILVWQARGVLTPTLNPSPIKREGLETPSAPPSLPVGEGARGWGGGIDRALIRQMIYASWPLMLINLLSGIFYKIDVTLLQPMQGSKVVGQYSTAYKWLDALGIIPSLFTMALLPILSRQAHEDRAGLQRNYHFAVKLLVMLALPVAVGTTFLAPTLIGLLGGANYLPDGAIALQLMVWFIPIGWINSLTNYVLIALDLQRPLRWAFMIGVGFNIIANVIFIPLYSYKAAAIITVLSELVLQIAFYRLLRRELAPVPWIGLLWKPVAAALIMFAVLFVLWPIMPLLALVIAGVAYPVVLFVLRPFNDQEMSRFAALLPAPVRRVMRLGTTV